MKMILILRISNFPIPKINVFSINESDKFYLLRTNNENPQNTIDLFLYEKDDSHYSLIKKF